MELVYIHTQVSESRYVECVVHVVVSRMMRQTVTDDAAMKTFVIKAIEVIKNPKILINNMNKVK